MMFIYFRFETTAKIQELEAAGVIVRDSQAATRKATAGNAGHNRHHLLIMALTADVFSNNHAKVKKCGMDGFISKPLQEDQLYRSLQDFLPSTPLLPDPSESTETMQALLDLNNLNQSEENSQQLHTQQPHFGAEQP
jgi:CheY-like chemotaxis protein